MRILKGYTSLVMAVAVATDGQRAVSASDDNIVQVSGNVLPVCQGSLYPVLHRLEHQGWIKAEWKESENNRRAKYYSLTTAGWKRLRSELDNWHRLSGAIGLVIEAV